ncbi:MAG: hypothetical protein ACYDA2_07140 [Acidimicrobiales bacterium]
MQIGLLAALVSGAVVLFPVGVADGATAAPPVTISPAPSTGYVNGAKVRITVGPNDYFQKGQIINILECGDPGGKAANLPRDVTDCDGSTIQPVTVIVNHDGSFSLSGYVIYELPNTVALGEPKDTLPKCDATHACVLYVGENQEDFSWPHTFSAPFSVGARAGSPGSSGSGAAIGIGIAAVVVVVGGSAFFVLSRRRRVTNP